MPARIINQECKWINIPSTVDTVSKPDTPNPVVLSRAGEAFGTITDSIQ